MQYMVAYFWIWLYHTDKSKGRPEVVSGLVLPQIYAASANSPRNFHQLLVLAADFSGILLFFPPISGGIV